MNQNITGEVPIDLGGPRILKFTVRSMLRYQEIAGEPLDDVFFQIADFFLRNNIKEGDNLTLSQIRKMLKILTISRIRNLLLVALLHQEPDIANEDVENLMEKAHGNTLLEKQTSLVTSLLNAWQAVQIPESARKDRDKKKELSTEEKRPEK